MTAARPAGGARATFPASFAQQRLWFLDHLQPDGAAYNLSVAVRLDGPFAAAVLDRALSEVVARHDSLRTTFVSDAGVPAQVVAPPAPRPLPVDDVSSLPAQDRDAALARILAAEATAPFDLKAGPLVRARLVRLARESHAFIVVGSHIVVDGISIALLFKELSALYAAFADGKPSPLAPPASQFSDYVAWQREHVRGPELDRQMAYWRERLAGELPPTELPPDRARGAAPSGRAGRLAVRLAAPEAAGALVELCRQEKAPPFAGVLAAFALLLQRYTGHDDVLVGSPFGNRSRTGEDAAAGARFSKWLLSIGFYAETVVLRTSLAGDPSFRALLGRARDEIAGAAAHVDVPFEKIVEVLRPAREAGLNPFFQIMLSYLAAPDTSLTLPGVTVTRLDVPAGGAMFDLLVQVEDARDGLRGYFTYDADLFDQATVERFAANLTQVLAAAVAAPDAAISAVSALADAERTRLLTDWNDTAVDAFPDCVHAEIERQVARTPRRVAVRAGDVELTYEELERRANQLARHLRFLGVGPGGFVGIALPRGPAMVLAVLATLKAGGAYVPLDPAYPEARLAQMIEDSGLGVVITLTEIEHELARAGSGALPLTGTNVVCLDAAVEILARLPDTKPEGDGGPKPEDLAYVIYTSGSTGKPKGVMLEHRLVTNFFAGMDRVLGPARADSQLPGVWLAATSLSFDISVLELLWTLARGFTVVVQTHEDKAGAFAATVAAHGVTHFQCTPSMASLLVADPDARAALGALSTMLVGGEALAPALAEELLAALGGALFNMYGPTETTIWSTAWKVDRAALARGEPMSIGRPIANTTVYVLDAHRQLTPLGVPGELYIGGAGVARGYLQRPELTEERFVPNPFGAGRLYRTGDLCRWRADGDDARLEFLGRLDHQVKIRGHRIELGEIEAAVREVGGVRDVVVIARADGAGQRLVAYMAGAAPTPTDLKRLLRERLPEPMVPSVFVVLEQLPLTPNGKVDRKALPAPEELAAERSASDELVGFVAPRTPTEQAIGEIWCEVLNLPRVSIYDNFYDLGGHSLLSPQVMHRIEERLKKRLNVAELILQNLAQVAAKCDQAPAVGAPRSRGVLGALKRMIVKSD
jgi:amino acid adenylation domain-containing protein